MRATYDNVARRQLGLVTIKQLADLGWTYEQVRGQAGEHQVDGARTAVGHAYGGGSQFFAMWVVGSEKP